MRLCGGSGQVKTLLAIRLFSLEAILSYLIGPPLRKIWPHSHSELLIGSLCDSPLALTITTEILLRIRPGPNVADAEHISSPREEFFLPRGPRRPSITFKISPDSVAGSIFYARI